MTESTNEINGRATMRTLERQIEKLDDRFEKLLDYVNHQNTLTVERLAKLETVYPAVKDALDEIKRGNFATRLTKLETWKDLTFWTLGFGVALAGMIIAALKFAGV